MEFVEQGILEGPELEDYLTRIMSPYLSKNLTGIVLGCTHYPFVQEPISRIAGPDVQIFDGSLGTARELSRRIQVANLNQSKDHKGSVTFFNSSPDPEKINLMRYLFEI
jgi:glutamate racemase